VEVEPPPPARRLDHRAVLGGGISRSRARLAARRGSVGGAGRGELGFGGCGAGQGRG
jgi:hypothetical protein